MEIHLRKLRSLHPLLPAHLCDLMVERAALAFRRSGHRSPVPAVAEGSFFADSSFDAAWPTTSGPIRRKAHDEKRITEDGAEAVILTLVGLARGWRVSRRLQQGESADWLMTDEGTALEIALEVSGVSDGPITKRLREKLVQVSKTDADERWAGVVGFEKPVVGMEQAR